MNKQVLKSALIAVLFTTAFTACTKREKPPVPDEQELITTVKLQLSNQSLGFSKTFVYKVENGFTSSTAGQVQIDTIKLEPGLTYDAIIAVQNEKANPVEDITNEIIEKGDEHLFVFLSTPASGAGSVSVSDGSKDMNGKPLNQNFKLTAGPAGSGKFDISLMHLPTNKNGTTPETAGGETDLAVSFPVVLQ
ncbi:MAG TPA: hypothetical protein VL092_01855 [Chitinophagaceae bacterium]|nr:hypothetical protein [Chitinophagaceae bacterium]